MKRSLPLLLLLSLSSSPTFAQTQNWQPTAGMYSGMGQGMAPGMTPGLAPPGIGGQGMAPGMMAPGMAQGMAPGMMAPGMAGAPGTYPGSAPGIASVPPGVASGLAAFPSNAVQSSMGLVPKFDPSFFQKMIANNVQAGTVLTGILENDIASNKSKAGDLFSIRLEDGLNLNGNQIIPQQSKILGTITSVVASRSVHGGSPGSIQISLQTLVFPDGRTCPFFGFVERNTLQDAKSMSPSDPMKTAGKYAQRSGYYAMNFFTTRVGFPVRPTSFGHDFKMTKGEVLPIRMNRSIDVTHMTPPSASPTVQTPVPPLAPAGPYGQGTPTALAAPVGLSAGKMGSLLQMPGPAASFAPSAASSIPSGGYTSPAADVPAAAGFSPSGTSNYLPGLAEPF